jgi:hypothetical protein
MAKKYVADIIVGSMKEFSDLFDCSIRTDLSDLIINKIIENIPTTVSQVRDIRIYVQDINQGIELNINRHEFLEVLEEHLAIYEDLEMYEKCSIIYTGIKKLKIGNLINDVKVSKKKSKKSPIKQS